MKLELTAYIDSVPMHRPRFNRNSGTAYNPPVDIAFRNNLGLIVQSAMRRKNIPIFTGNVAVKIIVSRNFNVASTKFGDIDNHVKNILDALTGIVWNDDSQVTILIAWKLKNSVPSIELSIQEVY